MNEPSKRSLFVFAIRNYDDAHLGFADGIDAQLSELRQWWCHPDLGDRVFKEHLNTNVACRDDLENLVRHHRLRHLESEDVAVLYITGHGKQGASGRHYLMLPDTPGAEYVHAYPTDELVTAILGSSAEHVLVIVNTCHAGALISELARLRKDLPHTRRKLKTLHVITVGDFDQRPSILDFTNALARIRKRLTEGLYATPHLRIGDFYRELDRDENDWDPDLFVIGRTGDVESPCLPNPGYCAPDPVVDQARIQVSATRAEVDYWIDRASGRTSGADPGWYFAGRHKLTTAIAQFLARGTGMFVVTGAAGTGKSALIARAVTLSDPKFRNDSRYSGIVEQLSPETLPPVESVELAVLARQKNAAQILVQLLAGLGVNPPQITDLATRTDQLRDHLHDHLIGRGAVTIVLDGLDEAESPLLLIPEVIAPLAQWRHRDTQKPLVKLVIGVRSETPTSNATSQCGDSLLETLQRVSVKTAVLRTDDPDAQDDVSGYLEALLTRDALAYQSDPVARHEVARVVANHVGVSFLDARLAGERLRRLKVPQDLDDCEWLASLSDGIIGLLRRDLQESANDQYGVDELLAVLRAAAFAGGAGVPLGEVWEAMASAVGQRSLPESTIDHVLKGRLGGYLARDVDDRITVYRPVHERLREVLRTEPDSLTESIADNNGTRR